ncbi:hypothetical protein JVU11DRAFT_11978 [Chiua virens]|nr:hypothetical protein JVU11DRAFT_11978 [Chiua virens]
MSPPMQEGGYRFTELTLFTSGIDRQFHNSRLPKTLPLRNISQQALMSFRYAPSTVRPISPAGHSYLKLGNRRAPDQSVRPVENIFRYFKSRYMYLGYEEHGIVTADIRAVTRAAFLTMAITSEYRNCQGQHHASGLRQPMACLRGSRVQINMYASSATELFTPMLRIYAVRAKVFGLKQDEEGGKTTVFLTEAILDRFTISGSWTCGQSAPCNSHPSLLAMVDCCIPRSNRST